MKRNFQISMIAVVLCVLCASVSALASAKQIATCDARAMVNVKSNHKWKKSFTSVKDFGKDKIGTRALTTLAPTHDYSFVTAADGSQWYATQKYTVSNYYIKSSDVTLYNSKGEKQGNRAANSIGEFFRFFRLRAVF